MSDSRPNPDALLKIVDAEEAQSTSGRLRIFFGMSAGVGKTYAMLKAAHQKKREGVDVLIGVVETHGRSETMDLLRGLDAIPVKTIEYKNGKFDEMDLDAILKRRPELVLVDELAHSNVPGSRHPKRYQDVLELLDAGIDVYTTINVQHLESRKEAIEQITQVPIRETVPDSIFERASTMELVDISPFELLKRLKEGKVYLGDKAELAREHFFKEDRLTALREIALRLTAERVDKDLQKFSAMKTTTGPWQTNERIMVAVSFSPYSAKLIRAARRLAFNLEAPWVAIYVDTGRELREEDSLQLAQNLKIARELGADVITTTESDIVEALKRIARQKNVTQIIVGRPTRRMVKDFLEGGSLLERLVRESGEIDVHVIRQDEVPTYRPPFLQRLRKQEELIQYWNVIWYVLGIVMIGGLLEPLIGYRAVGFIYLLGILLAGLIGAIGPVLFAAALSALSWNFFFIPPKMTFSVSSPEDVFLCVVYFVVAAITGFLTAQIREHEKTIREREERTNVLLEVIRDIANSGDKNDFLAKVKDRVENIFNAKCGVILKSREGKPLFKFDRKYALFLEENERAVASWVFNSQKTAGWSTDTLSESQSLFVPLIGATEFVGIFVFRPTEKKKLSLEQESLLFSITRQLAISIERHFFEKRLEESKHLRESEKLHQALLSSISHELRTPLTTIMGSATSLEVEENAHDPKFVKNISSQLVDASDRLNRVIENLLDMTRLSSGMLSLKLEWNDISDLIGVTVKKLERNLNQHKVEISISENLPMVLMDFRFMEHVLTNIIINASIYSPQNTLIKISSHILAHKVLIYVDDQGPGIPESDLERIFTKFYRVPGSPTGGTGLGLSIVKSIVEAHKGRVWAENLDGKGARFVIELPRESVPCAPP